MGLQVHRRWWPPTELFTQVRGLFEFDEDRATGYLFTAGQTPWPEPLAQVGPELLAALTGLTGEWYTVVAFQGYRGGAGCGWHADTPFDAQAVLSLGATRTFGTRPVGGDPEWTVLEGGDLVVMPSGFQDRWEHCVPVEPAPTRAVRVSLVFRTVR